MGDGWCDAFAPFNTAECAFDGGDCCADDAPLLDCRDPSSPRFGQQSARGTYPAPRNERYAVFDGRTMTDETVATTYNNAVRDAAAVQAQTLLRDDRMSPTTPARRLLLLTRLLLTRLLLTRPLLTRLRPPAPPDGQYEFGYHKFISSIALQHVDYFHGPWQVEVTGAVANPLSLDISELIGMFHLEERVYAHRCVEAWSIFVPWVSPHDQSGQSSWAAIAGHHGLFRLHPKAWVWPAES